MKEYYMIRQKLLGHYYIAEEEEEFYTNDDMLDANDIYYKGGRVEEGAECKDFECDKMYYCGVCSKGETGNLMYHFGYYDNYACKTCYDWSRNDCVNEFLCAEREEDEVLCKNCDCFCGSKAQAREFGENGEEGEYAYLYPYEQEETETEIYCLDCKRLTLGFRDTQKWRCIGITGDEDCGEYCSSGQYHNCYGRCEDCFYSIDCCRDCDQLLFGDQEWDDPNMIRCDDCYSEYNDNLVLCNGCGVALDDGIVSSDAFMCSYCFEKLTTNTEVSIVEEVLDRNRLFKPCETEEECCICMDEGEEMVERVCSHKFGRVCLIKWCKEKEREFNIKPSKTTCPLCRHSL